MKRLLLVLLLIAVCGFARMRPEQAFRESLIENKLAVPYPNASMMEKVGQLGFVAALGGYRSVVASFLYLQSETAFENTEWDRVEFLYNLITRLHPLMSRYWEIGSWQMAYNAASYYLNYNDPKGEVSPFVKKRIARKWIDKGCRLVESGLSYNPQDYRLHAQRGEISRTKLEDHRIAATEYLKAFQCGGPSFMERIAAYEMVLLPDRPSWEQAYDILMRHFNEDKVPVPSMLRDIPILEERLGIPLEKRINKSAKPFLPDASSFLKPEK